MDLSLVFLLVKSDVTKGEKKLFLLYRVLLKSDESLLSYAGDGQSENYQYIFGNNKIASIKERFSVLYSPQSSLKVFLHLYE